MFSAKVLLTRKVVLIAAAPIASNTPATGMKTNTTPTLTSSPSWTGYATALGGLAAAGASVPSAAAAVLYPDIADLTMDLNVISQLGFALIQMRRWPAHPSRAPAPRSDARRDRRPPAPAAGGSPRSGAGKNVARK